MNGLLRFVFAAGGALALGVGAGYVLLVSDSCSWFGSSFEGGCGYAALGYAFLFGAIVAAVGFALILRFMPNIAPSTVAMGMLAPYRGYHPAIALLALIPAVGQLIVAALLFLSKPILVGAK